MFLTALCAVVVVVLQPDVAGVNESLAGVSPVTLLSCDWSRDLMTALVL